MPVKALGRFTCVCKSWNLLIRSKLFIQTHLKNYSISISNGYTSSNQSPNIFLMPSYIKQLEKYSYSLFSDNTFLEVGAFALPMLYSWLELLFVGNSCNGIICFTDQKAFFGRKVFLYNPSLKKIKVISHDCFADSMYDRRRVYSRLGFGFSERDNDLKVVRIHYVKDRNLRMLGSVPPEVEVYSLKADCWRRIAADIKCIVHHRSVSSNGAIYWLARKRDRWSCDTILSFDVTNEVFCEIALPSESNSFLEGTILVFKGLLAFCKDAYRNRDDGVKCYELWVMMEYNVTNSWTKLSTFEIDQPVSKVSGFTKSGKLIMQMDCGTLASWDPLNNELEILKIDGFLNHIDTSFVESLVLYGDESIASTHAM